MCDKKVLACVLLVYATRGQLAEHPRLLHATPCERKVIAARRAAAAMEGRKGKAPTKAAPIKRRPPKPGEFDAQAVEDFLRARWFAIEAEMNK